MSNFDATTGNQIVNIGSGAVTIEVPGTVTLTGSVIATAGTITPAAPDAVAIANAGTAVTVFSANSINQGGVVQNPIVNTETLIINPVTIAGTVAGGTNFALPPGESFNVGPSTKDVSINCAGSGTAIPFSAFKW